MLEKHWAAVSSPANVPELPWWAWLIAAVLAVLAALPAINEMRK